MDKKTEINQERRCQVGLHNFPAYDNKDQLFVCSRCKYMQLPHEFDEPARQESEIKNTFSNMKTGHET